MPAPEIEQLISLLAKLPGLGPRSARRAALHMIRRRDQVMTPLTEALRRASDALQTCQTCGNLDTRSPCSVCADPERDGRVICVVEDIADLWALERTQSFRGRYHVLGGTLSPLDGIGPDDLTIAGLLQRAEKPGIEEIIIATNATVAGQTTAHYLRERLGEIGVKTSRLAHGVPVGGELDYLDDGTLAAALKSRRDM